MAYYSEQYYIGKEAAHRRAVYKGIGLTDKDLERPLVAVINTFSEVCPGHFHLKNIVQSVKNGIWQAGATPLEFSTISQCATQTLGLKGIHFDLPARELIALDIETIVETQIFDGMVIVTTCDKTIPGVLLAAARLNIPTIIVPGGIMETGVVGGKEVSLSDLDEKVFSGKINYMTQNEIEMWEDKVIPGSGACPIMGTANTMQVLSEFAGVSMPFSSTKVANSASQLRLAKQAGCKIVELIESNIRFGDILTKKAMENMISGAMAIGAASNSILHMLALSHELGYEDTYNIDYIAESSKKIPCVLNIKPVGDYYLTRLEKTGGVPVLMYKIKEVLDNSCRSVSGKTIGDIIEDGRKLYSEEDTAEILKSFDDPVMKNGGIVILKGNLASSAVVRAFRHSKNKFIGTAKVFETQHEAMQAVKDGKIKENDAIVLRFMGPKGGPGMPDCFGVAGAVVGAGLEETVAIITDGRFSGFAKGVGVCQICPEGASGGPIAKVKDGDKIIIDTISGTIMDMADDFDSRKPVSPPKRNEKGILKIYSQIAKEAIEGARL